jgi:hypothetical protein
LRNGRFRGKIFTGNSIPNDHDGKTFPVNILLVEHHKLVEKICSIRWKREQQTINIDSLGVAQTQTKALQSETLFDEMQESSPHFSPLETIYRQLHLFSRSVWEIIHLFPRGMRSTPTDICVIVLFNISYQAFCMNFNPSSCSKRPQLKPQQRSQFKI